MTRLWLLRVVLLPRPPLSRAALVLTADAMMVALRRDRVVDDVLVAADATSGAIEVDLIMRPS